MTMVGSLGTARAAFTNERAARKTRPPRVPLAVKAGRAAARVLPAWATLRRTALVLAGFGSIDYAVWQASQIAGYAAIGVSLLLLDWLTGGEA